MPWKESTAMSQRTEFLVFASITGANISQLCRRFGISRQTGYKWLRRRQLAGAELEDRSRRPHSSPGRTPPELEAKVLAVRECYPFYGGRKIRRRLLDQHLEHVPAASTVTAILERNGLLGPERRLKRDWQRFEHSSPNALWQMDFKGHVPLSRGRCHPLTVLDDHSRFNVCLAACADEQAGTVRQQLVQAFEHYGLPECMLMDNGSPWGAPSGLTAHTGLTAWLIRLGVTVKHGRPHHPQTQGKEERFHRTLKLEVLSQRPAWRNLSEMQQAFDSWRDEYNFRRPHQALGLEVPGSRYMPSLRSLPATLPPVDYNPEFDVRRVQANGRIKFHGLHLFVGKGFAAEPVGLRQVGEALWDVYYCHQRVTQIDLSQPLDGTEEV
jgi:transposase InsO family protein